MVDWFFNFILLHHGFVYSKFAKENQTLIKQYLLSTGLEPLRKTSTSTQASESHTNKYSKQQNAI